MQRVLECSVCSDFYVRGSKPPKTLTCGHSFCAPCLHSLNRWSTVLCPKCRIMCDLPHDVDGLPTAYSVLEMLESVCEVCHNQSHNGQCSHCDKNVCDPCREVHMAPSQSDYDTLELLIQQWHDTLADDKSLKAITNQRETIKERLTYIKDEHIGLIEEYFNEKVAKVTGTAQEDINRRLKYTNDIDCTITEARKLLDEIRKQQRSKSNYDGISVQNQIKDIAKKKEEVEKSDPSMSIIDCSYNKEDLAACLPDSFKLMCKSPSCSEVNKIDETHVDYFKMESKQILEDFVSYPHGVCINPNNGQVIVSLFFRNQVLILSESLDLIHTIKGERETMIFQRPHGVACDGQHIYIADYNNNRVCVTDLQGNVVDNLVSEEKFYPSDLAIDASGHLYVCDLRNHRIKVITKQGVFMRDFGAGTFKQERPSYLAVSSDNKVAVSDESGNLYLFTTSGQHIRTFSNAPPRSFMALGVVFDGHGNILLSDNKEGRVIVMSETGEVRCFIGKQGEDQGELLGPHGLAITHSNDIVVCDQGNNRLQLFSTK